MSKGDILTGKEVCAMLQIAHTTLYRMVWRNQIPHFKVAKAHRFHRAELEAWMRLQSFSSFRRELRPPMT